MTRYMTMTVSGSYGSDVVAATDEEAEAEATAMGYEVLDIVDNGPGEIVLVIAD